MKTELFTCVEMKRSTKPVKRSLKLTTIIKFVVVVVSTVVFYEVMK